jgi:hypothetical protein
MFVFALAALSIAGQISTAHAAGARDVKSPEQIMRETKKAAREAEKSGGAAQAGAHADVARAIDRVTSLSADQARALKGAAAKDVAVAKAVSEITSSNDPKLARVNAARLEALAAVPADGVDMQAFSALSPTARAGQSLRTLALNAKLGDFKGEALDAVAKILENTNAEIRSGKSAGDALMSSVRQHLKAQNGKEPTDKEVEAFIESIKKFC